MTISRGLTKLAELISSPDKPVLLRGEIWVAPQVLETAGLSQGPDGLVELASMMGADICFFPLPKELVPSDLEKMAELSHDVGMECGLTIDGPFQRLSQGKDTLALLEEVGKKPLEFQSRLKGEEAGNDLFLLCDDLAYAAGLYFSASIFRESLLPLYRTLVSQTSEITHSLGWHSDGDVSPILSDLVDCGFRFFSLEPECVDLLSFKRTYGNRISLIGGIPIGWLTGGPVNPKRREEYREGINALAKERGLILSTSCGLYDPKFLPVLKEIYQLGENM
jgi:uroporphyrinogen decarboxylase